MSAQTASPAPGTAAGHIARRVRRHLLPVAAAAVVVCEAALAIVISAHVRVHLPPATADALPAAIVVLAIACIWRFALTRGSPLRPRARAPHSTNGTP